MKAELVPFETVGNWDENNWDKPQRRVVLTPEEVGGTIDEDVSIDAVGNLALVHMGHTETLMLYIGNIKITLSEQEWQSLAEKVAQLIPAGHQAARAAEAVESSSGRHRKNEEDSDGDQTG